MTHTAIENYIRAIENYIRRIRSADKRRYAILYAHWRRTDGAPFDFNGGPEDPALGLDLSYMGRQSVRMHIDALIAQARGVRP